MVEIIWRLNMSCPPGLRAASNASRSRTKRNASNSAALSRNAVGYVYFVVVGRGQRWCLHGS